MQAIIYEILQSGQFLTGAEREILRWGHNAKVVVPKRFHASGKHINIYKQATAVECLVRANSPQLVMIVDQWLLMSHIALTGWLPVPHGKRKTTPANAISFVNTWITDDRGQQSCVMTAVKSTWNS